MKQFTFSYTNLHNSMAQLHYLKRFNYLKIFASPLSSCCHNIMYKSSNAVYNFATFTLYDIKMNITAKIE